MKADPGNRIPNRKLDEALEGKGMSIVNVYWFCLLALEYVALFCQSYLQTHGIAGSLHFGSLL